MAVWWFELQKGVKSNQKAQLCGPKEGYSAKMSGSPEMVVMDESKILTMAILLNFVPNPY